MQSPDGIDDPRMPVELNLLLEEYRALRSEITASLQAQHTALSYGFAALALFIIAVASAWDKSPKLTAIALIAVLPVVVAFLMTVWGMEVGRMRRAGSYLAGYLERRINRESEEEHALVWEQWLAGTHPLATRAENRLSRPLRWMFAWYSLPKSRTLRGSHFLVILILTFFAATSFGVGVYRLDGIAHSQVECHKNPSASAASSAFCKDLGIVRKGATSWYYRVWSWPSWPRPWEAWEFWTLLCIFMLLPIFLATRLIVEQNRSFTRSDLPSIPDPPARGATHLQS